MGYVARRYDSVVVGSGPNGLAAAVELARQGQRVLVLEAAATIGGGTRTEELTLPGTLHDVCSAVHPLGAGSPYFRSLPLDDYGLEWCHPEIPLAHPFEDGTAAALHRSLEATSAGLGADGAAYTNVMAPLVNRIDDLFDAILAPLLTVPRRPILLARFGASAGLPLTTFVRRFRTESGKALMAGLAAHSITDLRRPFTTAIALVLAAAGHVFGWPFARGGSQAIAHALAGYLHDLGGEIVTEHRVTSMSDVPDSGAVIFDLMPAAVAEIAADRLPARVRRRLAGWEHGPGSFKVDWLLDGPVPWTAEPCRRAGTVHVGGHLDEIVESERSMWTGSAARRPFVLVAQPSVVDDTRAPEGRHVVWGYCHAPAAGTIDLTERIEEQIELHAPGFRDRIVARHTMTPLDLEARNPNYPGGDIGGGAFTIRTVIARPRWSPDPYHLGDGIFIASAASPPGAGVHGMAGYHAARSVLRDAGA
jgi:phytoene dehydrogenase-like protein